MACPKSLSWLRAGLAIYHRHHMPLAGMNVGIVCEWRPAYGHLIVPGPPGKDVEYLSLKEQEIIRPGNRINQLVNSTAWAPSVRNMGMNEGSPPLRSMVSHPSPNLKAESTYSSLHLSNSCPAIFSGPEPVLLPPPRSQP